MSAIEAVVQKAVAERVFPGCGIGILKNGARTELFFGHHTYAPESLAVSASALYDCASITKAIPTATLALQALDEGKISLDDSLITYIPEYQGSHRDAVTLRHLLTYTLGNTIPLSSFSHKTGRDIFAAVCHEHSQVPGTVFNYSNTPAFLMGIVLERVLKMPLDQAAHERIFEPRGMKTATFTPLRAVPAEEGVIDIVHDASARVFAKEEKAVGHAGLFATVGDLLAFLEHLLQSPDERLTTNQIQHLNAKVALGWELDQPWMGEKCTSKTFGKTGFTGTSIVCDFTRQTAIVILSNRTYPQASPDRTAIDMFRSEISDIVFS